MTAVLLLSTSRHCLATATWRQWNTSACVCAVVAVLSPEFVRKKHPMGELHTALARQNSPGGPQQQQLCPIFYSIGIDECSRSDFRKQYDQQPWDVSEPKPGPGVLDKYAEDIKELCTITGLRTDQFCVLPGNLFHAGPLGAPMLFLCSVGD